MTVEVIIPLVAIELVYQHAQWKFTIKSFSFFCHVNASILKRSIFAMFDHFSLDLREL